MPRRRPRDPVQHLEAVIDPVSDELAGVMTAAGDAALEGVDAQDEGMFDRVNVQAVKAAKERGAELVGRRYSDQGELVDNPNPRWAITESTREGIKSVLEQAVAEGWSTTEFAAALEDSYTFSAARAEMIARTEVARAHEQGQLSGWRESGVVTGKRWVRGVGMEDQECEECDANAADDVIGIEEFFSSGDDVPPAHPNCVCALVPVTGGEEEDEE